MNIMHFARLITFGGFVFVLILLPIYFLGQSRLAERGPIGREPAAVESARTDDTPLSADEGTEKKEIVPPESRGVKDETMAADHSPLGTASRPEVVPVVPGSPPPPASLPGPLVVESPISPAPAPESGSLGTPLTAAEIIALTNAQRARSGLSPLLYAKTLAVIAEAKAVDMIERGYFAHVAPDGTDIGGLAERYGYAYLRIGENLALGDFSSSSHVVSGWMNSPGHRENIMNAAFTEIGVGVLRGNYEGREVWFAVQEFGRPISLCPEPEKFLLEKIEIYEGQIASLAKTLERLESEIETPGISRGEYIDKAKEYNTIVELYNKLVTETKADIDRYNAAARAFNTCVKDAGVE